jgi:hypothetical protein
MKDILFSSLLLEKTREKGQSIRQMNKQLATKSCEGNTDEFITKAVSEPYPLFPT